MNARRASLTVRYDNVEITEFLQPHLKNWSYTDNLSGEADDLQITLEDKEQLWSGDWLPDKGATLTAMIKRENWGTAGDTDELWLGQFEIDELEINSPPSSVSIKSISVPESSSLRGEEKYRAWEKTHLSIVSRDVAKRNGLEIFYDTDDDPEYDRVEQAGETDLAYLMRLCSDAGLCLKVSDAQIIIFDEQKYESQEPINTITKGEATIKNFSGRSTLNGLYKACRVDYQTTKSKTKITYTFTPPDPPNTERILVINERVTSLKDAERLAKKKLRQANREGTTVSFTLLGDIIYFAGLTTNLEGFGKFDGKYIITQAIHAQQGGYETQLQLRKCLEGY